jgi:hypothetical protein
MKFLLYAGLVLLVVPVQTIVLAEATLGGIKPDVGLIAAALIGLISGELDGLLVGLTIGWLLSMYSAGGIWPILLTTGGTGLFAGLLGRQVAHVTPAILFLGLFILSMTGGVVGLFTMKAAMTADMWTMMYSIVLPQACLDAVVGSGLFWLAEQRFATERLGVFGRFS